MENKTNYELQRGSIHHLLDNVSSKEESDGFHSKLARSDRWEGLARCDPAAPICSVGHARRFLESQGWEFIDFAGGWVLRGVREPWAGRELVACSESAVMEFARAEQSRILGAWSRGRWEQAQSARNPSHSTAAGGRQAQLNEQNGWLMNSSEKEVLK